MNPDPITRLDSMLVHIQQRWGAHALRPLSSLPTKRLPGVATGFPALDQLLAPGGIPRGQTTELLGRLTSGMTTLGYKIIANAQTDGSYALYIDLDGAFDPDYAARCGICLDRLFLARPDSETDALDVTRDLLERNCVGAITVDLGEAIPDLHRLCRLAALLPRTHAVILLLMLIPAGIHPAAVLKGSPSALRLLVELRALIERETDIRGYQSRVTLLKHPTAAGKNTTIDIDFDATIKGEPE